MNLTGTLLCFGHFVHMLSCSGSLPNEFAESLQGEPEFHQKQGM
ncbi:MAG: hypothetical protein QNJ78_07940 [Gammaproteobacteria bacterium]|nr:hypothetical protein [Gammaproteobacteria bacterium]